MKIGITCYPTYGGSGDGRDRARTGAGGARPRGALHLLLAADPAHRAPCPTSFTTRLRSRAIRCSNIRRTILALATRMAEVAEILRSRPAARSLRDSAFGECHAGAPDAGLRPHRKSRKLPYVTTLHGTDITLVGADPSYLPITRFSIEQSDGVTSISKYLKERTIEVFEITDADQGHSQLRELRHVSPHARDHGEAARNMRTPKSDAGSPLQFPSGQAQSQM